MLTEHYFTGMTSDPVPGEGQTTGSSTGPRPTEEGGEERRRMVIVNVYCPMYDPARDEKGEGLSRLKYKMDFYRLLEGRCSALEKAGKYVHMTARFRSVPLQPSLPSCLAGYLFPPLQDGGGFGRFQLLQGDH